MLDMKDRRMDADKQNTLRKTCPCATWPTTVFSRAMGHDPTRASTMRGPSSLEPWHSLRIIKLGSNYISFKFNQ